MEKREFKAESKRLLDLMINSIYTHKEIFLRELISNASDALDKLYFRSLTDHTSAVARDELAIDIAFDKENRTLTVSDNGIGMTEDELENNLGTIAQSGSLAFKAENAQQEDIDIIGQFGVGFYSAFMVSDRITVISRPFGGDTAFKWESDGVDGYTLEPCEKDGHGTEIILKIKEKTEQDDYDEFLDSYRLRSLIKKYSDYIRYPIRMDVEKSVPTDEKDEHGHTKYETQTVNETINSMLPLWKKNKSEITSDEYNAFYRDKYYDFEEPLLVIHSKTEGSATYNALMYVPSHAPYDYYSKDFEKGLQLYASGVLISDRCADLLPDHFSFVKGLVDSEDLSLNISREMLQHDHQLKLIAKSIEKKIKSELSKLLKNDRSKYEKFFNAFGLQLKFGIYNDYGANRDLLKDLVMFYSSSEKKLVTLAEYVSRMKDDQKEIYFASGESVARIDALPQTELVKDKGFEILYLTDNVDEFAIRILNEYDGKTFKSISDGDLDLESDEEREELKKQEDENRGLLEKIKSSLGDSVDSVVLSKRLKTHPVCLTSEGGISLEMEKVLNAVPGEQKVSAKKVLEINPNHHIMDALKAAASDDDKLKKYAELLYMQALLIEGMTIDDPVRFSNLICDLM